MQGSLSATQNQYVEKMEDYDAKDCLVKTLQEKIEMLTRELKTPKKAVSFSDRVSDLEARHEREQQLLDEAKKAWTKEHETILQQQASSGCSYRWSLVLLPWQPLYNSDCFWDNKGHTIQGLEHDSVCMIRLKDTYKIIMFKLSYVKF